MQVEEEVEEEVERNRLVAKELCRQREKYPLLCSVPTEQNENERKVSQEWIQSRRRH